jgi:hypothetical protein
VRELSQDQDVTGCWDRFHSMDSSRKSHFSTTEIAINRALALGLDMVNPQLAKAAGYTANIYEGNAFWPELTHSFSLLLEYNLFHVFKSATISTHKTISQDGLGVVILYTNGS